MTSTNNGGIVFNQWLTGAGGSNQNIGLQISILQTGVSICQLGGCPGGVTFNSPIGLNTWKFITLVFDGSMNSNQRWKFYLDSNLIGESGNSQVPATIGSSSPRLTLFGASSGYIGGPITTYSKNQLDDIAIYNRALTQAEITALYTGNPPCVATSSTTNLTIPSTSLPYTWNGLSFNTAGTQTAHLTNACGADSAATLNLTVTNTLPSYLPSNGLVAWYPFNGNANDESGNGNNGTVYGATLTTDRFGNSGKAYSFDGVNDYIKCLQAGPTGNPIFTATFWLKTAQTSYGHIIGYGNDAGSGTNFRIYLGDNSCAGSMVFDTYDNALAKTDTHNNSWEFYTIVYDGSIGNNTSIAKIYKNGSILSNTCFSVNNSSTNISNALPIVFGRYHGTAQTGFFNGSLDDIAIYNRALTQAEIQALYKNCTSTDSSSFSASACNQYSLPWAIA